MPDSGYTIWTCSHCNKSITLEHGTTILPQPADWVRVFTQNPPRREMDRNVPPVGDLCTECVPLLAAFMQGA